MTIHDWQIAGSSARQRDPSFRTQDQTPARLERQRSNTS